MWQCLRSFLSVKFTAEHLILTVWKRKSWLQKVNAGSPLSLPTLAAIPEQRDASECNWQSKLSSWCCTPILQHQVSTACACGFTAANSKTLQRLIDKAQKIIGCPLPSLQELFNARCQRRAQNILRDPSHPGHSLFQLLLSGKSFRTMKAKTNRPKNSFYPRAITELNSVLLNGMWCGVVVCMFVLGLIFF